MEEQYTIRGTHVLADFYGVNKDMLDDEEFLKEQLKIAAEHCGATVIQLNSHKFEPNGVTCAHILAESHITCHTYPNQQFIAIDVYTCGAVDPQESIEFLKVALKPKYYSTDTKYRGTEDYLAFLD